MTARAIVWLGSSRADLRRFPKDVRRAAGFQLQWVQEGLEPEHWRPMPIVGLGVREIRITTALEHRVLYVTRFRGIVCVIHAFEKKSRRTSHADLEVARRRLRIFQAGRA